MFVIIWEYRVDPERAAEFEKTYGANGPWAELFKEGQGFLRTELLYDEKHPGRYLTIDRWLSLADYEKFLRQWNVEYSALDAQCDNLTIQESLIGKWESVLPET